MKVFKCPKCGEELEVPESKEKDKKFGLIPEVILLLIIVTLIVFNIFKQTQPTSATSPIQRMDIHY